VRVPTGAQNLRVVAANFEEKTQQLVVRGRQEGYEITLAPLP